jgi:hypothetical protein
MRWSKCVVAALATLTLAAAGEPVRTLRFDRRDAGQVPAGWKVEKTGRGEGSVWKVVADDTAPGRTGYALAQTAESPNAVFNLCVREDTSYRDLEVGVAFKAVRGKNDQGGGIVWRYRDHDNYYIARMNPLENNYRVYKVVAGRRMQLGTKEGLTVKPGEWHRLTITMQGDHIRCALDSTELLDVRDSTFPTAGKVGLWSKSDAQTHFDGMYIRGRE